jgi:four helix bundle protein
MAKFRFMDLDIWKEAISLNNKFFDISEILEKDKQYRMSDQLRGASLSISNNIAEGSGASSSRDFAKFLNYSRRSIFECANIAYITFDRGYINGEELNKIHEELDILGRKITRFIQSISKTEQ